MLILMDTHHETIPCQASLFDIPKGVAYFNCAYTAPLLRSAREAASGALSGKSHPWEIRNADFFAPSEHLRREFAELIEGDGEGVAVIPAVSYGVALAAANLKIERGRQVVVLAEEFPSQVYQWRSVCRECAAEVLTVPRPDDGNWTAAVLELLTPAVAVVCVPHCHWADGGLIDLRAVGAAARTCGAALVVDATQSLGAAPFSVREVQPDFMMVTTHKWLMGPYSFGLMYFAPHLRQGRALEENWTCREGSEDLSRLTDYCDRYRQGARRYDVGEMSNFLLLPMARAGLRQIMHWQVPRVAATLRLMTDRIAEAAADLGLCVCPSRYRHGHMIGLHAPGGLAQRLAQGLRNRQIFVSVRGDYVRISPHVYNSPEDIDCLTQALREELARA